MRAVPASKNIKENGDEVHHAASNDKEMPDAMPVPEALIESEEDDPHGVEQTSGSKPDEAGRSKAGE